MKMNTRLIQAAVLLVALAATSGCDEKVDYTEQALNFDVDQDLQTALQKNQMPMLATRLSCAGCHSLDHKVVGPAWKDVGKRYQNVKNYEYNGKSYPLTEGLVQKISQGGSGNWGTAQMPAIDPSGAKRELITKLVGFILELGKR